MFFAAYHFDGDPDELVAGYDRLIDSFPPEDLLFHACVVGERGITIFDACPSREDFQGFSTGSAFREAVASAGLPDPRVEPLGDVHAARSTQRYT